MMDVEDRLIEWAKEKFYPGWEEPSPSAVLGRLMDEGADVRRRRFQVRMRMLRRIIARLGGRLGPIPCKETRTVRMEHVVLDGETTVCPPDGGLGAMVERMASSIERSRRAREIGELLNVMPRDMFTIAYETYGNCASPRDIPNTAESAARRIGISERTYFTRKKVMLRWLAEQLGVAQEQRAA